MKKPLIAIVGPTASGKSEVALEVAGTLDGEIVSADSAQIYRGMDIGTAKLLPGERRARNGQIIPHHLIDVVEPNFTYNIGVYQAAARQAIAEIHMRHKLPVLCGGSGLYVNSVINESYVLSSDPADVTRRGAWMEEEKARGEGYLYGLLQQRYPHRAAKIQPRDYQRILRALERNEDLPEDSAPVNWQSPYQLCLCGLIWPRERLYERIEIRVEWMFEQGLVDEVRNLLNNGYDEHCNALCALGYKEILPLLRGEYDEATAKDLLKRNTRHFAKRQMTWFKRDPRILWYDMERFAHPEDTAVEIIKRFRCERQELPDSYRIQ